MSILKSETKILIMGMLNAGVNVAKERLYSALYAGLNGAEEAKTLGEILRAKEDFDTFAEADMEVQR